MFITLALIGLCLWCLYRWRQSELRGDHNWDDMLRWKAEFVANARTLEAQRRAMCRVEQVRAAQAEEIVRLKNEVASLNTTRRADMSTHYEMQHALFSILKAAEAQVRLHAVHLTTEQKASLFIEGNDRTGSFPGLDDHGDPVA